MVGSEGQAWMTCLGLARRRLSRNEVLRRLALGISAAAVLLLLLLMARGIGVDLGGIIWSSTGVPVVIGAAFAARTAVSLTDAAIISTSAASESDSTGLPMRSAHSANAFVRSP